MIPLTIAVGCCETLGIAGCTNAFIPFCAPDRLSHKAVRDCLDSTQKTLQKHHLPLQIAQIEGLKHWLSGTCIFAGTIEAGWLERSLQSQD